MEIEQAQKLWQPEPGWLNTASYGLPPEPAWAAMQEALTAWRVGRTSWEGWGESTHRARVAFAGLIGVPVGDVAVEPGKGSRQAHMRHQRAPSKSRCRHAS